MIEYVTIINFYRSAFMRMVRILFLFFLTFWLYANYSHGLLIKFPLLFLSLFLMIELFYLYKIYRVIPKIDITKNNGQDLSKSCTRIVSIPMLAKDRMSQVIDVLIHSPQGQFILQKIPAEKKDIPLVEIQKQELLAAAFSLSKTTHGRFITAADVICAYLLLTETQSKLLFNKQIKKEELLNILAWVRQIFRNEEYPPKKRVEFYGSGIIESLTTGWTYETKKFTKDYSYSAYQDKPQIQGREKEFTMMVQALSKAENNNVLLIGDPGSGKENLVSLFAQESFTHLTSISIQHIKILELMIGPLIAGTANRAELETRLQSIIEEVSHSGNIVLYIPEIQNITGSGAYDIDLSGALYPYLKSGRIPIIASISKGNFKNYFEKSPLLETFSIITLEEPDKQTAMEMLMQKTSLLEKKNNVVLTYKAIESAVEYANRYFQNSVLPGSAASVLEDVAHTIALQKNKKTGLFTKEIKYILADDVINAIQTKTHIAIAAPIGAEKELLLHLEENLHQRVIDQVDAITAIAESMRRLRSGLISLKRPISFLFLGPTGVGKTESAKALSELYFGGEDKMIRLDMSEYADEDGEKRLLGAAPGEGNERGELTDKIADRPNSLVLLDEFEKAHPKILDLFLQVLEDGRLTDNKGKTVSFANSIVIATSNAGAEFIREKIESGVVVNKEFSRQLLDYLQTKEIFKPELLNRFDEVIVFKPLGVTEMTAIAKILLTELANTLKNQDIAFSYDDKLLNKIIKEGFNPEFGARPLRRYIQDNIEDIIAQKKLRDEIKRGNKLFMTTDETEKIIATIS
jgi:ATP-dependent Clp protease ATP-binding subunit ClpA